MIWLADQVAVGRLALAAARVLLTLAARCPDGRVRAVALAALEAVETLCASWSNTLPPSQPG